MAPGRRYRWACSDHRDPQRCARRRDPSERDTTCVSNNKRERSLTICWAHRYTSSDTDPGEGQREPQPGGIGIRCFRADWLRPAEGAHSEPAP